MVQLVDKFELLLWDRWPLNMVVGSIGGSLCYETHKLSTKPEVVSCEDLAKKDVILEQKSGVVAFEKGGDSLAKGDHSGINEQSPMTIVKRLNQVQAAFSSSSIKTTDTYEIPAFEPVEPLPLPSTTSLIQPAHTLTSNTKVPVAQQSSIILSQSTSVASLVPQQDPEDLLTQLKSSGKSPLSPPKPVGDMIKKFEGITSKTKFGKWTKACVAVTLVNQRITFGDVINCLTVRSRKSHSGARIDFPGSVLKSRIPRVKDTRYPHLNMNKHSGITPSRSMVTPKLATRCPLDPLADIEKVKRSLVGWNEWLTISLDKVYLALLQHCKMNWSNVDEETKRAHKTQGFVKTLDKEEYTISQNIAALSTTTQFTANDFRKLCALFKNYTNQLQALADFLPTRDVKVGMAKSLHAFFEVANKLMDLSELAMHKSLGAKGNNDCFGAELSDCKANTIQWLNGKGDAVLKSLQQEAELGKPVRKPLQPFMEVVVKKSTTSSPSFRCNRLTLFTPAAASCRVANRKPLSKRRSKSSVHKGLNMSETKTHIVSGILQQRTPKMTKIEKDSKLNMIADKVEKFIHDLLKEQDTDFKK
ncbi:unnamed protein product [Notodromas monacha]|uniref:Uncharacterized protein n=1 Tax=Notodromas monacha TaxID=399045 RepID=A0A7R9BHW0_9CRUS|nr:unnamed protein product [Notodromas monacha]CAG0914418.1 unnamed protein product [Notodromas monacha]